MNNVLESNKKTPAIFFITGASGAGKTTLVKNLKTFKENLNLQYLAIHDFDEWIVPKNANQEW